MVQPSIEKKPNNSKMGFTNIGNFGKRFLSLMLREGKRIWRS